MLSAVCSRASRERPVRTTCAPSSASLMAIARPMPRPAPVMTATWPANDGDDSAFVKVFSFREDTVIYSSCVIILLFTIVHQSWRLRLCRNYGEGGSTRVNVFRHL